MIRTWKITVPTAGSAGTATGSADSSNPVKGRLLAVFADPNTEPATTDVTIATKNAPVKTLLTITNLAAAAWYYPRAVVHDEAGAALTGTAGGDRAPHPIDDYVTVSVAQADPNKSTLVWLITEGDT